MKTKTFFFLILLAILTSFCSRPQSNQNNEGWITLFNGKDLNDWKIKITGHPLGENYKNTFRIEDGILKVSYSEYDTFRGEFGHIFYKTPFSHYKLRVEYRFTGEQVPGGPSWGLRNTGVMLHSQSPESMLLNQDFPVSIECQLLGGLGAGPRPTANVCTPGTNIVINNQLITQHCTESSSKTFDGDQWVTVEVIVLGDSIIHHIVNGDTVLTYTNPQIGGDLPEGFPVPEGSPLKEGYISLQAESHPCEFRKVELLNLRPTK